MRRWEDSWPNYLPRDVEFRSVGFHEVLSDVARKNPSAAALISDDVGSISYRELDERSSLFADALNKLDVGRGDKAVFMASNSVEAIEALYGLLKSGLTTVVIDPTTMSEDLLYQLGDAQPKVMVVSGDVYERESATISKAGVSRVVVLDAGEERPDSYQNFIKKGRDRRFSAEIKPERDAALVFYYAGIAGRTEQVLHSHYGVASCAAAYGAMYTTPGLDRYIGLLASPITHVLGLFHMLAIHHYGGAVVVMRGFNAERAYELVKRYGVTHIAAAPMFFDALTKLTNVKSGEHRLRLCLSGGAPLPREVYDRFREAFGVPLLQTYGLTEALLVSMQTENMAHVYGTVGAPIVGVDVKIVDDSGREKDVGEAGELAVRSPWIMMGYSDPADTARAIRGGWLYTGDLMSMDENGLLFFRGVKKRIIKYKAYPVFPRDLEDILLRHPAVREALVVGEPDQETGQRPVAYVVLHDDARGSVSSEELMSFVNQRVAAYKKIRACHIVDRLPS